MLTLVHGPVLEFRKQSAKKSAKPPSDVIVSGSPVGLVNSFQFYFSFVVFDLFLVVCFLLPESANFKSAQ